MSQDDKLVTRNDVRAMGLDVSNTSFQRYEKSGYLTPIKIGRDARSALVRYRRSEVEAMLAPRK